MDLVTRQGEYCFEEMNYFMFLEVSANKTDIVQIRIDKIAQEHKCTEVDVRVQIHRDGNAIG